MKAFIKTLWFLAGIILSKILTAFIIPPAKNAKSRLHCNGDVIMAGITAEVTVIGDERSMPHI